MTELVLLMNFVSESSSDSVLFDEETVNSCLSFSRINGIGREKGLLDLFHVQFP